MKKPNKKTHKQYEETIPQPSAHPHRSSSPCPAQADPMLSLAISHQSISNSERDRQTPDKIELPLQAIRSRYGPKPPKPPSRPPPANSDGVGMGNPRGRVSEVATADRSF
ncbi:predicted protein [Histoplasma capsulatum var. duboisii H88]|uniref:Predicted protein n=1 Tax=Ajellomyces capsulatus (strain H88) TaxID=544711 RepID=F0UNH1_AJEC8|nr:predicted protein [Histoplasma capsulatum var. duboisii H88]